jgi:ATP-dependent Clp protease ATP-binding subunit ClpA
MASFGIGEEHVRQSFENHCPAGETISPRRLGRSPDAKKAMKLATKEASNRNSKLVRTQHLLLGIMLTGGGKGFAILGEAGVSVEALKAKVDEDNEGSEL